MAVQVSAIQSTEINEMLVGMIKVDRDKAVEFVTFSGRDPEEAEAYVATIEAAILVSDAKDRLKGYGDNLVNTLQAALDDYLADNAVDEVIEQIKVEVEFSRTEVPDKPGEIIGGLVKPCKMRLKGEERLKATSTKSNGGGGKSRVPVPQSVKDAGCNSWVAWFRQEHPDEAATKDAGASYSAPRALEEVEDATYLAAKATAAESKPEATE